MAVFSRIKTWVSNEVLTASDLNAEFNNLLNNTKPESIEDYSADVATMQTTADPGGVGTESLPSTLSGELTRLRYAIKRIINGAQWYSTPVGSLSTGGIPTAAIAANAVTRAKMAAANENVSSSCGTFTTANTTATDVTSLSATLTTTGGRVYLELICDPGSSTNAQFSCSRSSSVASASILFIEGSTQIAKTSIAINIGGATSVLSTVPASGISHNYIPSAGTYTWKIQVLNGTSGSSPSCSLTDVRLRAYELIG